MLVDPVGVSRADNVGRNQGYTTYRCSICGRKMEKVEQEVVLANLPLPQKIAHQLRRISVDGWHCSGCQPYCAKPVFHTRVYSLNYWKADKFCSVCQEFTAEVVEESKSGRFFIMQKCYCCGLVQEKKEPVSPHVNWRSSNVGMEYGGGDGGYGGGDGGSCGS